MSEYYIAQDRWCVICRVPAAYVVVMSRSAPEKHAAVVAAVCSEAHGKEAIKRHRQRERAGLN